MNHIQTRLPKLLRCYRDYLLDESGAAFVHAVSQTYDIATLSQLATRGSRIVRRAAVLALGMLGDMGVNDLLGGALRDSDRGVRLLADQWLRDVWFRDGDVPQQLQLRQIARLNQNFQFDDAWQRASELINAAPSLAESYHQRAIASACLGEMEDAASDCQRALNLNPFHFAAAAAMAQAMVELDDQSAALKCFERALHLNPSLEGVRARVRQLQRQLRG